MPFDVLVLACLAYVILLFIVAFLVERRAVGEALPWLRSPLVYTLSLSIYCTAWTFYGAVGYAARSGLEFLTIYLGPTLVFVGWWWVLRKLVRIGRQQRVTSIADLISSRYGKSNLLGILVTLLCVVAATPYIALQLQSVTLSFSVFASGSSEGWTMPDRNSTAIWVAAGLALFTILFGTRKLDANEQHTGIVTAIAVEGIVKLVALVGVGSFVVWGIADGPSDVVDRINRSSIADWSLDPSRWAGLTFLSAAAVVCLPRMFQVLVVETGDERHLATASWAFPLYMFLMSLFVVPIAVVGLEIMPAGANPDLFVLTVPLDRGQGALAMLAFLGGFSSATAMVIVAAVALSTMVSNHIVMPLWLSLRPAPAVSGDVRRLVLLSRRISIAGVLALGYGYYRFSGGSGALAAIGLISFVGVAQILPAMLGGIFWRGATRAGALWGLTIGFAVWIYTLFLPSLGPGSLLPAPVLADGPFGIDWLRPQALFGVADMDPLIHSMFWSLVLNATAFFVASLVTFPGPLERLQGAAFVNVFETGNRGPQGWAQGKAEAEELLVMAQRILGEEPALAMFEAEARAQGKVGYLPDPTPAFVERLERRLAGSVGAATAHAMLAQLAGRAVVSVEDLMAVANETAQIMEYSARLEAQQDELTRTARQLRDANEKLTRLSVQKDAFLSQISHELRTPMTSIRAFSEILMEGDMPPEMSGRYARIIHDEAIRLTRLLDDLLDLSVLENGSVQLNLGLSNLHEMIDRALQAAAHTRPERGFVIHRDPAAENIFLHTDGDRLAQVFINLISNARKYCDAEQPELRIAVRQKGGRVTVDFIDNGSGISKESQELIFEKFARLSDQTRAGGAGLGLAICREVMANLGGTITYLPGQGGAAFRVTLPLRLQRAA
ncbi:sodium:solute symporter [Cereibacter sphaeroides]|uniref:ATP-binding protein n=1 Tax=Cereibacter sphaeroides TaxID=1063 RepID=UPI001F41CBE0|nr:ATP-binding protein [Cereibacter sphaeroides]MCE6962227.1 sodium:solute symporter [Cereibacter sphaeroides]MCE6971003.1 sodium:solute symporter [Cereibacter sphaeroides]MCE6972403.1 sodium:solute symporter [Cereibacter sphaeroides]